MLEYTEIFLLGIIFAILRLHSARNESRIMQKTELTPPLSPWERDGFFPKRGEDYATFRARVKKCIALRKSSPLDLSPLSSDDPYLRECREVFFEQWGCYPSWMKVYDKKPLGFPFILAQYVELVEDSPNGSYQVSDQWIEIPLHSKWLLWTFKYSLKELLQHEWVHAVRFVGDDDRFEESIAYLTARTAFRRYFGSLLSDPILLRILLFFFIISASTAVISLFPTLNERLFSSDSVVAATQSVLLFLAAGFLSCFGNRLIKAVTFARLVKKLKKKNVLALLLRLDTRDIVSLLHTKERDWSAFFDSLPGLYGLSIRKAWRRRR